MEDFRNRLKISNEQRKEIQRYLNTMTILTEETMLKVVRKMKDIERRLDEAKYNR